VLYGVWGAVNDSGGPILAGTLPQGAFLALLLLGVLGLLGRRFPNGIAGFCIAAVPGAMVVAIIQFATGTAGSGWLLLGAAVGLVVVRILVAQAAARRAGSRSSFYN